MLLRLIVFLFFIGFSQASVFAEVASGDVKTYTVVPREMPMIYSATGSVESRTETDISSRITSRIMKVSVRTGDSVKKDQLLVQLEDNVLRASVLEAQNKMDSVSAAISSAKEAVKSAEAEVELTKIVKARNDKLYAKRAISKKESDYATSNYKKAVAELSRLQQNVERLTADKKVAEQTLERTKTLLTYSTIKSPMDGVVAERRVDPGDLAVPDKVLLKIFDPERLLLQAPVRESLIKKIKLGEKIAFYVQGLKKHYTGEIKEIVPYVDTKTRTFLVKACIDKSKGLIPGMYGMTDIKVGTKSELLVPENAITRVGQTETVLLKENGKIKKIFVRTIPSPIPNMRVVVSGLKENDEVILKP